MHFIRLIAPVPFIRRIGSGISKDSRTPFRIHTLTKGLLKAGQTGLVESEFFEPLEGKGDIEAPLFISFGITVRDAIV